MIERSRQAILVTDSSKFERTGFVPVKLLTAFQKIITNANAPLEIVEEITALGVKVILVKTAERFIWTAE